MADVLFFCVLLIVRSSPPQNTATWGISCPRAAWKTSSRRVRCARRNVRWRSGYRAHACPSVSFARVACIRENGRVSRQEQTPPSKTPSRKTSAPSLKDSWRRKSSRCKSRSSVKDQRTTSCRGQSERSGVIQARDYNPLRVCPGLAISCRRNWGVQEPVTSERNGRRPHYTK